MDDELSMDGVRVIRLRSQRLHPETSATAVREAVAGICGVQAQDQQAAGLAVRARSQGDCWNQLVLNALVIPSMNVVIVLPSSDP